MSDQKRVLFWNNVVFAGHGESIFALVCLLPLTAFHSLWFSNSWTLNSSDQRTLEADDGGLQSHNLSKVGIRLSNV